MIDVAACYSLQIQIKRYKGFIKWKLVVFSLTQFYKIGKTRINSFIMHQIKSILCHIMKVIYGGKLWKFHIKVSF